MSNPGVNRVVGVYPPEAEHRLEAAGGRSSGNERGMGVDRASEVDFSWIQPEKARSIVERFHAEAVAAFANELYIASVALSGGVLEGILAFALLDQQAKAEQKYREKYPKRASEGSSPADWYLPELIDVAYSLGLVGDSARSGAWAVKDFRNLIHPGKLLEKSPQRWRALAKGALAAIEDISPSLAGRMQEHGSS